MSRLGQFDEVLEGQGAEGAAGAVQRSDAGAGGPLLRVDGLTLFTPGPQRAALVCTPRRRPRCAICAAHERVCVAGAALWRGLAVEGECIGAC